MSVGVKEIDLQHQEFINILNNLYDYTYQSKSKEELEVLLSRLASYATNHFKTEEKYFDDFNYEFAEEHKSEHSKLLKQIAEFQNNFQSGQAEVTVELIDFLEDWLVHHLGNQDKKYIQCFAEHGLS